jgi:hypothetical protein
MTAAGSAALAAATAIERLRAGRSTTLTASGTSMRPFLFAGERVVVRPCAAGALRPGDLVAFERSGRVVLHRVIAIPPGAPRVLEKGDGLKRATAVSAPDVLGRVAAILGPAPARLSRGPQRASAPWLARLSALHGAIHRSLGPLAERHPRSRLPRILDGVDAAFAAAVRFARGASRAARTAAA